MFFLRAILIFLFVFFLDTNIAFSSVENLEGLNYEVTKISNFPMDKNTTKKYDLYELYLENNSGKTFSIPGYSIDLGINYSAFAEVEASSKDKSTRKAAVLNLAAGAASFALGGIAKTAASTAARSIGNLGNNKKKANLEENVGFLSSNKTYILYPNDGLSLFFFVSKNLFQVPNTVRFVCRDEESNSVHIVINDHFRLVDENAKNSSADSEVLEKQDILAAPGVPNYK